MNEQASEAPSVEAKAREMGWQPKEEFRGPADKWIDADKFVERGEHLMPILQANNRKLLGKVSSLESNLAQKDQQIAAATEAIEELKKFNFEMAKDRAKVEKAEVLREIKQARDDGDVEKEAELTDKLSKVNNTIQAKPPEPKPAPPVPPRADPVLQAWMGENSWFGQDAARTDVANGIANRLRADPANAGLIGRPFLDRVAAETEKVFGGNPQRQMQDRVEGGRPSGSGGSGGGRSYGDLPANAKEACEKQGKKLIGEGRAFKDLAAWRAHYVKIYFRDEQ